MTTSGSSFTPTSLSHEDNLGVSKLIDKFELNTCAMAVSFARIPKHQQGPQEESPGTSKPDEVGIFPAIREDHQKKVKRTWKVLHPEKNQ
ncbi:hypothetical protein TNCV_3536931 [Trichonephila clavipes]|uniref:Uncharacterized protein n=1 Tax=Trichonephila clavipes TaxID=2585209 RepID=A0A8X7BAI1_TRICX|nr:hypothetical protein TNCV_3536931 [Trichonephila clavipes]